MNAQQNKLMSDHENPKTGVEISRWSKWFARGWWFEAIPDDTAEREIVDFEEIYQAFKARLLEETAGDRQ